MELNHAIKERLLDEIFQGAIDDAVIENVLLFLKENGMIFPKETTPLFANHLLMLLIRMQTDQQIVLSDEELVFNEISPKSQLIAKDLCTLLENYYGRVVTESELFLLAVYFELEKKEGKDND